MESLSNALTAALDYIQQQYSHAAEEVAGFVEETEDLFFSQDPSSDRSMIIEQIFLSDDAKELAIHLIAENQLLNRQITPWGAPMPEYKPSTIRYKAKRGFPPEWRVRYTEYDTGRFYNYGIHLVIDRANYEYWIEKGEEYPHFEYIPAEYIGFTPDNRILFEEEVSRMLNDRLMEEWMNRTM